MELQSVEAYMRRRLTIEKVRLQSKMSFENTIQINAAIEDFCRIGEVNAKRIAAAKSKSGTLSPEERTHVMSTLYAIHVSNRSRVLVKMGKQKHKDVQGRLFFLDSDLKGKGVRHFKKDLTGTSILNVLRHLGKLQEVCPISFLFDVFLDKKSNRKRALDLCHHDINGKGRKRLMSLLKAENEMKALLSTVHLSTSFHERLVFPCKWFESFV